MARIGIQNGKVSTQTGLSVDAIRFYEREGLLESVSRTEGGFRLFNARDVQRLEFILQAQRLGFSLSEIRKLLTLQRDEICCYVRDLLRTKLAGVRAKLRELGSLEDQLARSLRKCERKLKVSGASHQDSCPCSKEWLAEVLMRIEVLYFEGRPTTVRPSTGFNRIGAQAGRIIGGDMGNRSEGRERGQGVEVHRVAHHSSGWARH